MARIDVVMPQMGESIAEGTLSKWLKKVGDPVKRDEPIFEISTDKVDAEIPSAVDGVLTEILVPEGETVAVQALVARIETEVGASVASSAGSGAASATKSSGSTASGPAAGAAVGNAAMVAAGAGAGTGAGAPPQQQSAAGSATGQHPAAAPASVGTPSGNGDSFEERIRRRSSPLVRKIAAEHGIEIGAVPGSGIAGRVTKKDILGFMESGGATRPRPPVAGTRQAAHAAGAESPMPEPWAGDLVEPMSKMRALISEHMVVSRRTSAHVTSFFEADFTRIARIRARHRAEFEATTGQKLTYMPFIIKAVTNGLKQFPVVNSSVAGTNVIYRKQINIGIAVALDWGLIVPVIRNADDLSLTGLTRALNDVAARARAKKLQPDEVQNGTFTITNPGVFGSLMGTPIINQPQVAIMGVGAIEKRPKVIAGADGEDTIAIRTCAYLSLSFDHRVIDGATADQFLAFVKKGIESFPEAGL